MGSNIQLPFFVTPARSVSIKHHSVVPTIVDCSDTAEPHQIRETSSKFSDELSSRIQSGQHSSHSEGDLDIFPTPSTVP